MIEIVESDVALARRRRRRRLSISLSIFSSPLFFKPQPKPNQDHHRARRQVLGAPGRRGREHPPGEEEGFGLLSLERKEARKRGSRVSRVSPSLSKT